MISKPPDWTLLPGTDHYTLIAPEGPTAAAIRYVERVRPLRRMGDIVADWLRRHKKLENARVGTPERLITVEGEYAGFVTIAGEFDGAPAETSIGVVFGDDFYSRIEGFAIRAEQFERIRTMVRELTENDRHVLGARRRRYIYAPPDGWQPLIRGFITDWICPSFPRKWALVTVHPATPLGSGVEADQLDVADVIGRAVERGFEVEASAPPTQVETGGGLSAVLVEIVGRQAGTRALRSLVALSDSRYVYTMELTARTEDAWPDHREAFAEFWRSVEPIPERPAASGRDAFGYWAE